MFCTRCGKESAEGAAFCMGCGNALTAIQQPAQAQQGPPPQAQQYQPPPQAAPRTACPKCGSTNISFQAVQVGAGTRNRGRGCLWTLGRWTLIICTLGLWLLVGRSKGKSNTKIKTETQAICQGCGNRWKA